MDLEHLWGWGEWLHGSQWRPQSDPTGRLGRLMHWDATMGRGRALRPSSAAQGGLCVGKAPPGPWPGTGCGAPASSPQPCITAGRLQRVAIDREMARRGAAATPATRRAVRLARCAVPRSAKLHYGSPVGARLWVRDFHGFFTGVCARDQGMWPIGPDSRDYEEAAFGWGVPAVGDRSEGGVVGRRPSATVEPALPHTTTRTLSPAQIFRPTEMTSDHNQSVRGLG